MNLIFKKEEDVFDNMKQDIEKYRKPEHVINSIFINRWSPRAMSGEELSDEELNPLFEAARWAPSSYNEQPWRFIIAKKNTSNWDKFFDLLVEQNKVWAKNAAVLVVVISRKTFSRNDKPNSVHAFDAGAAWENLALQGAHDGFVVHGMAGFDYDKAKQVLEIPDEYQVQAMIAIGKQGKKEDLPEHLQEMDKPSGRKPISETVFEGKFREKIK